MKTFLADLKKHLRALRLSRELTGEHFILIRTLTFFLPIAANYITVYFSGRVITALTEGRSFRETFSYALLSAILVFVVFLFRRFVNRANMDLSWSSFVRRETALTRRALALDYAQAESPRVSAMLGKIEHNSQNMNGIAFTPVLVSRLLTNIFSIMIAVVMASGMVTSRASGVQTGVLRWVNTPAFAVLFVLFLLGLTALTVWSNNAKAKMHFKGHEKFGKLSSVRRFYESRVLNESGCVEDIRIFHEKPLIMEEIVNNVFRAAIDAMRMFLRADATVGIIPSLVVTLTGGAVYIFVGLKALSGAFGAGKVVEYYGVLTAMITAFSELALEIGLLRSNKPYLEEDLEFFDLTSQMRSGSRTLADVDPDTAEFTFHDVSFRYPETDVYALRHLDLTIRRGEKLAVVGRNGSGKSTMIKLLCRLYDPTEGTITVNGIDIREFDYSEYLRLFGVVFQDFTLMAFSVGENVAACEEYDEEKVWRCLDMAGVGERVRKMPKGLAQCITALYEEDGEDLSGGEEQKVAIARALYKDAPFVILDEPTAALDPKSEAEIYARFDEISGGRTAVYISHRMSSCRFCERIVVFADGAVVEDGTHADLLKKNGAYAELWNAQAQHYVN